MNYEEFLHQIELRIRLCMGKEVRTSIIPVMKNNSIKLDGLSILREGDNVSPAIYLNEFYRRYLTGESLEDIVAEIIGQYHLGKKVGNLDTSFFTEADRVRSHVVCRLINYEKNRALLQDIPYRMFLDLAIVYYCLVDHEVIGNAAVLVRREHLDMWGMDEDTIHAAALKNTKRLLPYDFISMAELLHSMMQSELLGEEEPEIPLYILSNREKCFGAVWMTDLAVLDRIGRDLKSDYYILPSSVHECMVVPAAEGTDEKMLREMVKEINETQVAPDEILADTVYRYNRQKKLLRVVGC